MTIQLALTDDWELRGNGSGNIEKIQFQAMRELLKIYDSYGVKSTFNVEVMQQLTFKKLQDTYPQLRSMADAWDDHVRDAFRRGHDIQLHIHPQWSRAEYEDNQWVLSGDWSLLNYDSETAYSMLAAGKEYLEKLLRPLNPDYRCISFRSGASAIAPSTFALQHLADLGIVFDISVVQGLQVKTRNLDIDYSNCEEGFLPFYPCLNDARKVSNKPEPIICVPIFHFHLPRRRALAQVLAKIRQKAKQKITPGGKEAVADGDYATQEWLELEKSSQPARVYHKAVQPCLAGKFMVADIGQLDFQSLRVMLAAIRRMVQLSGQADVPVILTNHSKYIQDFSDIDRFIGEASQDKNLEFVTLTTLAEKLKAGEFPIKTSAAIV